MSLREAVITKVFEAGGRLTVRSALNPILWLCAIITPFSLFALSFAPKSATTLISVLICLAAAPVAVALFGFLFLLFFDRDKLQSEDFQIRKRSLELIEQKGEAAVSALDVEVVANPEYQAITSGGEDRS